MSKFEKKFGKYAIPNLTMILIIMYAVGYVIEVFSPTLYNYLTLNPYLILHGQVWRIFSWLLIPPPSDNLFFTIIMLYFYYSIGVALEKTWGDYKYNVFIFMGVLLTVIASFACYGLLLVLDDKSMAVGVLQMGGYYFDFYYSFSTYYINMSIFLAFALTYPNVQVLLMFIIPIKVKWLGIFDAVYMIYEMMRGTTYLRFAIIAALLNVLIFYLTSRNFVHMHPKQIKRRTEFKHNVSKSTPITRHKCAICGRTEEDSPDLEFRFCSKCNGNYEFCQNHLFTHEHFK